MAIKYAATKFPQMEIGNLLAITEVQNIIMAKLHNVSNGELDYIIKQNNSGNGLWGCFKSISCLGVFILILFVLGIGLLSVLL